MSKKSINYILIIFILLLPAVVLAQGLENPLGSGDDFKDPRKIIGMAVSGAMSILGSLALAMFVYGGFIWMLSRGNPEKVKKGTDILTWAFIGLIIIFSSYAIVSFIMGANFLSPFLLI